MRNEDFYNEPLIPEEEFDSILHTYKEAYGKYMTEEDIEKLYSYLHEVHYRMLLYELAVEGLIVMSYDNRRKEIVYQNSPNGQRLVKNNEKLNKKSKNAQMVEDLLNSLDEE